MTPPDPGLVARVKAVYGLFSRKGLAHLLDKHPNTIDRWLTLPGGRDEKLRAAVERLIREGQP